MKRTTAWERDNSSAVQAAEQLIATVPDVTAYRVAKETGVTQYIAKKLIGKRNKSVILFPPEPSPKPEVWPTEGRKDDGGKMPWHLLPPDAVEQIVAVLKFGATKYGDRNWEKGMAWSRPFAALMRHMWAWWRGEDRDPETGLSHLAHAGCCILFLLAYEKRNTGKDDRPHGTDQTPDH